MAFNRCIGCDSKNSSRNLINIQSYYEKFSFVTGIKDLKSYSICESCNDELQISYNFKRRVLDIYMNARNSSETSNNKDSYFNDIEKIYLSNLVDIKEESSESEKDAFDSSNDKNEDNDCETNDYFKYMDMLIPETCLEDGPNELNDSKQNACKFCYIEFNSKEETAEHEVIHQKESQPYHCPHSGCQSRFKTKNYLKDHFRVHSGERPYPCRFCPIAFKSTSNRSRHERKAHPVEYQNKKVQVKEEPSSSSFNDQTSDVNLETERKPLPIDVPEPSSNTKRSCKRGNKEYCCRFCDKTFRRCDNWKRHEAIHSDERPYKCECEKSFKTKDMLRSHQKTHFKVYQCEFEECDKKFDSIGSLEAHKRTHTGERPFSCPEPDCDRTYTSKKGLREHQRRQHIIGLRYVCDLCGKRFNTNGHLTSHRRYHTGERLFTCDVCDKACFSQNQLKIHKRYHSGERPYNCLFCDKAFFELKALKIHKRQHTGSRPFKCHICTSAFVARSILRRHLQKLHGCSEIKPGINYNPDELN